MTRRVEAGPVLVTLGALLLAVSLFLDWFEPGITAWAAFEVWDLVLLVLALGCIAAGVGLVVPDIDVVDRRWLPAAVAAVAVISAAQIIDPPPAAAGQDPEEGAWLALGSAALMCIGGVLTFGRVHVSLVMEGRDPRRRVTTVDAREPQQDTTDSVPVVPAEEATTGRRGRLFSRGAPAEADTDSEPVGAAAAPPEGNPAPGSKQD